MCICIRCHYFYLPTRRFFPFKTYLFNKNLKKTNLKTSFKTKIFNLKLLITFCVHLKLKVDSSFSNFLLNTFYLGEKNQSLFMKDFLIFKYTVQRLLSFTLIHLKLELLKSLFFIYMYLQVCLNSEVI